MRILFAYLGVILIWSTTPLAIKWSGESAGFIFGVAARMILGTVCMLLVLAIRHQRLPAHSKAKRTYFAVAVQLYVTMMSVYWGAQFIPSGWVAVIFGLSPFLTALFASLWLNERRFSLWKCLSYVMGISGLSIMFHSARALNDQAVYGIFAVLLAVSVQTASAVWVKRIHAKLPAAQQVTGGLLFALPAYFLTWLLVDNAALPTVLPMTSWASILYLGLIATTIGFVLYYYILLHLPATTVGMIPLITPISALYIGYMMNHETITLNAIFGTFLILLALISHEFIDRRGNRPL